MLKYDAITIGKSVTAHREHLGMSIKTLARKTGISVIRIKKIEAGERRPHIASLAWIAWVLGMTIDDLVTAEIAHEKSTEN
ncbi:helix-turn-helix domain-containing protein [Desulfitobacterium chlororespirans]|uniref:Helix-turn-helix n=1 Tax=Desulfitobacterium chlororespirans DSM 11544 TaxID=1121395 RepID=A0A1M7UZV9_9FIRM|nr:helix-turn-helix transcriptional regulator [Desulfitobacterium chlororespirans]SHN88508.1 Helix-turn-helix [Desulfitobacterium chlororespirans DSM 11544]